MHKIEGGIHIRAVILAAGRGKRLAPLTDALPKPLIQCAGNTLLGRIISDLQKAGITEISIGIGWKGDSIREYVETHFPNSKISIIDVPYYEIGPLKTLVTSMGTGSGPILICPGDFVGETGFLQEMIEHYQSVPERQIMLAMDTTKNDGTRFFIDKSGILLDSDKSPSKSLITGRSAMILIAESTFLDLCRKGLEQGKTRILDVLVEFMMRGDSIHTWVVNRVWFDVDSISEILHANRNLLTKETPATIGVYIPEGDTFETGNRLFLDSGIQIDSGVTIHGPTFIARDTSIDSKSEIGPYVSVGEGTKINRGCFISDAVLFGRTELSSNTQLSRVVVYNNFVFME